jgi:hypothetical protein
MPFRAIAINFNWMTRLIQALPYGQWQIGDEDIGRRQQAKQHRETVGVLLIDR